MPKKDTAIETYCYNYRYEFFISGYDISLKYERSQTSKIKLLIKKYQDLRCKKYIGRFLTKDPLFHIVIL